MIYPGLYISDSDGKGRGVFTTGFITADTIVEISPVIVMSNEERQLLDKTLLHDYIFEWGADKNKCCMALGVRCTTHTLFIKIFVFGIAGIVI